jgi:hypothetical protein
VILEIAKELEVAMDRTNKMAGEVRGKLKGSDKYDAVQFFHIPTAYCYRDGYYK